MDAKLHSRAKRLFLEAHRLAWAERSRLLADRCGGDDRLRREVESLLGYLDGRDNEGDRPAAGERIGRYRLVRQIGRGGMGVVWEAEQERPLRRRVALKLLRRELMSDEILLRFDVERQALAAMEHPNIATVFDAGTDDDGQPFFAMEYVEGLPITDYCHERRLSLSQRLELMIAVCRAVEHAHRRGVIHRDLKPSNLLVATVDDQPLPKVIDFGVAKATGRPLVERTLVSAPGRWMGTPEYMSPEQAESDSGAALDGRTDVYSLGVVLYELLVGCRPHESPGERPGLIEMRRRVVEEIPTRPSDKLSSLAGASAEEPGADGRSLVEELRGDLDRIALTALSVDPRRRYTTPGELADEIERHLVGRPVTAPEPRRADAGISRPVIAATTLAGLVALVAVLLLWPRGPASDPAAPDSALRSAASIAVLPFDNLSGKPDAEYFGDGLAEELLNELAQVDGLKVAARTSSFAFKGRNEDVRTIGRELDVANVLEGSVRRSGDRLRVSAQLIDAETGHHRWSSVFDRGSGEIFAIQSEIARSVATALELELLRSPAGDDGGPAGYADYLQAREKLRRGSPAELTEAIELFESVLEVDPDFSPALTGLAESKILLARRGDLPMEIVDAEAGVALGRALDLDPEQADAHATLGLLRSLLGDYEGAEIALERAIELNDNLADAHLRLGRALVAQRRGAEADAAYERALELDPLNPAVHHALGRNLMNRGEYDGGLLKFQQWLRVDPESAETYRLMSLYARTYGRLDDATRWARRAVEIDPTAPLHLHELAMAYSMLREYERASEAMDRAYALAPNNHWTFTLKAFLMIERGAFDELEEFLGAELARHPVPSIDPLPQIAKVRLALAARSKIYQGDYDAAVAMLERALGAPFASILETGFDVNALVFLAFSYQKVGRPEAAGAALARCKELLGGPREWIWSRLILPDTLAAIAMLEGREDEALARLEEAVETGWSSYSVLRYSPLFEPLWERDDYRAMTARLESRLDEQLGRLDAGAGPAEVASRAA